MSRLSAFAAIILLVGGGVWWGLRKPERSTEPPPSEESARFEFQEVGELLGIDFHHDPGHPCFYYPEIMGGGVAVADFNRDGRMDLLIRGCVPGKGHPNSRPGPTSRIYLQSADGRFVDVTKNSGLTDDGYAMGVAVGDVDNDGVPDVYFCNFGEDKLYAGKGDGTFQDVTASAGIANTGFAMSVSFFDFDRDGRLDLYVANYVRYSKYVECASRDGRVDYCRPDNFSGMTHKLYRNVTPSGAGPSRVRFEDVSARSRIAAKRARGLGALQCDVNDDGWPDLYVANDLEPNFLWINQKDGTFKETAESEGAAVNGAGQPQASMGVAEGDVDGDGRMDLLATNFRDEYTIAYCRRESGWQDRSGALGLLLLTQPFTGFGIAAVDVDADGVDEIIQVNGRVTRLDADVRIAPPTLHGDVEGVREFWSGYRERSQLLHRVGRRFEDAKEQAGDFGRWIGIGRSLAVGDLDADGRPDLVAVDLADRAKVFVNKAAPRGAWLTVRTVDPSKGGRDALGALVTVVGPNKRFPRRVRSCGGYQAASQPCAFIGLGETAKIDRIEVIWPDGDPTPESFPPPPLNSRCVLERGRGARTK